jgi:hypothetical protein
MLTGFSFRHTHELALKEKASLGLPAQTEETVSRRNANMIFIGISLNHCGNFSIEQCGMTEYVI